MTRLLTGIALIAVAAYLIFWAPGIVFFGAAVLMSLLCYREFSVLVACHGIGNPGLLGVLGGVLILLWPPYLLIGMSLLIVVSFTAALRATDLKQILPQVAAIVLAAFYTF